MALNTQKFGTALKEQGFGFYSGVPCSFLKYLINYAINECHYVMAANEGDAVATAAGAYLGGKKSVVLLQNSGLTNATSPLTSLTFTFKIPVLGFVSLRGEPGLKDEPQHELMGQITEKMLSLMRIKWEYLSADPSEANHQLTRANEAIENNETFFFVVKKDTFEEVVLKESQPHPPAETALRKAEGTAPLSLPTRTEALKTISHYGNDNTILLATTGKTGRELFEIGDKPHHFYMVGSMGCISSLALGLALARPDKEVIAIDGDGAALMRLGNLATIGYYKPDNLLHIVLDNHTHDSTGGQATVSPHIDFSAMASAAGYPLSVSVPDRHQLAAVIDRRKSERKATFVRLRIAKGSPKNLGRPTVSPAQVKDRLIKLLRNT